MKIEGAASDELLAAALWYDDARPGLGDEFLAVIDQVLRRIEEAPASFARDVFDVRACRALLPRFPYVVVFVLHEREVRVVAFAHAKRRPRYWAQRV